MKNGLANIEVGGKEIYGVDVKRLKLCKTKEPGRLPAGAGESGTKIGSGDVKPSVTAGETGGEVKPAGYDEPVSSGKSGGEPEKLPEGTGEGVKPVGECRVEELDKNAIDDSLKISRSTSSSKSATTVQELERIKKIKELTIQYRKKLKQSGVYDSEESLDWLNEEFLNDYRNLAKGEFLDFLKKIDENYPLETQKIFLGSDGYDYLGPSYQKLSKKSNVFYYDINRKMLASKKEFERLYKLAIEKLRASSDWTKLSDIERISRINEEIDWLLSTNNPLNEIDSVVLYKNMNRIIQSAANLERTGRGDFYQSMSDFFDCLIMKSDSRQRALELIAELVKEIDLKKPILLIDYVGVTHAQSHFLKLGIEWLGKHENFESLTPAQKNLLGVSRLGNEAYVKLLYKNTKVNLHVGISSGENPRNVLRGLQLKGINELSNVLDIESSKTRQLDPAYLKDGKKKYVQTDAVRQSETWAKIQVILDGILNKIILFIYKLYLEIIL